MKRSTVRAIVSVNQRPREQFFEAYDEELWEGDIVVVYASGEFHLATVVRRVDKSPCLSPHGDIVCKVDFTKFNERAERRRRAKELREKMDERIKQLQAGVVYEMFAEKDPELKEMLEQFKSIEL